MPEDDAHQLLSALRRLTGAFTEVGYRFGDRHGLTRSDVAALIVVTEATERGATIGTVELARRTGLTAPSATVLADRLVNAGLLARQSHPSDRRRVVLTPTPAALAAGRDHFGVVNDRLVRMLATHSADELRMTAAMLEQAADIVTATIDDPTSARDSAQ